jgi:hypothetical protein
MEIKKSYYFYNAESILEYCFTYLKEFKNFDEKEKEFKKFKKTKLYKDMLKEIIFMIETD